MMEEELVKTEPTPEVVEEKPTEETSKGKKPKSKVRKIIEWSLFGIFGVIFGVIIAGTISGMVNRDKHYGESIRFGVGTFVIQTSSMEPDIPTGSGVITYLEDVTTFKARRDAGEILDLTFKNVYIDVTVEPDTPEFKHENGGQLVVSGMTMTHRLVEVHEDTTIPLGQGRFIFVTTGINHNGEHAKKGQYQEFTEKEYLGTVKVVSPFMGKAFDFITNPIGLIVLLLIPAGYLIVTSSIDILKTMKESEQKEEAAIASGDDKLANLSAEDRERLKQEMLEQMLAEKRGGKKDED